jgi:hypothetical protein
MVNCHPSQSNGLSTSMQKRLRYLAALLVLGVLILPIPTKAQTGGGVRLLSPETDSFPRIQVYMDVHDAQGAFVHGLEAGEVRIQENGLSLPIVELSAIQPGVQAVLVLNPGNSFAIRNSKGASRYDLVRDILVGWLKSRRGSTIDDLSLLVSAGPERTHTADPQQILDDLEPYQPDFRTANTGLEPLIRAVDVASDASPRPGMERAVLFITAPMRGDVTDGLETLITRAREQGVRIYIWLVASPDAFNTPSSNQLRQLAEQSDGGFFTFSSEETLPNPEIFFSQLRDIYRLSYDSHIAKGGQQQLAVDIQHGDENLESQTLEFSFDLQPPEPMFISPSPQILRSLGQGEQASPWKQVNPDDLFPKSQTLQVLVDFPDGRPRSLKRTALYVDGKLMGENTVAPYDTFTWDLSAYTTTGRHILQVEAEDELGLTGKSIETLVDVIVTRQAGNPLLALMGHWPALAVLGLVLAGAFALMVLVLSGRIRPQVFEKPLGFRLRRKPKAEPSPVLSPAQAENGDIGASGRNRSGWVNRLHWPHRRLSARATAYLTILSDTAEVSSGIPIPISAGELTLGSDPAQASLLFDDSSVDARHARLTRTQDGSYRLTDEGSVAGTWVNYNLIPAGGAVLEHGDLVHLGRAQFRFTQREPQHTRKPVVVIQEPYL